MNQLISSFLGRLPPLDRLVELELEPEVRLVHLLTRSLAHAAAVYLLPVLPVHATGGGGATPSHEFGSAFEIVNILEHMVREEFDTIDPVVEVS